MRFGLQDSLLIGSGGGGTGSSGGGSGSGGGGIHSLRASALQAESLVNQAAIDRYTFIRRAYLQRRRYLVYDGQPPPLKEDDE